MATQTKTLTTSYQLLAGGPLLVTLEEGENVDIHIASSAPADTDPAHTLYRNGDRSFINYLGTDNVYAKKPLASVADRTVKVSYTA